MREATLLGFAHPDILPNGWTVVRSPDLAKLSDGEPTLGWEGDPRLCVATDRTRHVLFRLEADNEYRGVCVIDGKLGPDTINKMIVRLIEIDGRRGWDAMAEVDKSEAAVSKARADNQSAFIGDWADKFHYALSQSHIPGIDVVRIKNAPRRG